jgi:hypothetical protein
LLFGKNGLDKEKGDEKFLIALLFV